MQINTYDLTFTNVKRVVFQRRQYGFWATFTQTSELPGPNHTERICPYIEELERIHKALTTGGHCDTIDSGRGIQWWNDVIFCWPLKGGDGELCGLHCNVLAMVEHMLVNVHMPTYDYLILDGAELEATNKNVIYVDRSYEERNRIR